MTRRESPWYCPTCEAWNGWKLDRCLECRRDPPRVPIRYADVPVDDARRVDRDMRFRAKLRALRARLVRQAG